MEIFVTAISTLATAKRFGSCEIESVGLPASLQGAPSLDEQQGDKQACFSARLERFRRAHRENASI